jgi:F0F1-type ATP synthase membrane subunit a
MRNRMKVLKYIGIAWGLVYLVVGILSSFTINNIDTYSSIALLALTFLLPLPITVAALWFPKTAGAALILSLAIGVATLVHLTGFKDAATASPGIWLYILHFLFGVAYIIAGRTSKNTNSIDKRSSLGTA